MLSSTAIAGLISPRNGAGIDVECRMSTVNKWQSFLYEHPNVALQYKNIFNERVEELAKLKMIKRNPTSAGSSELEVDCPRDFKDVRLEPIDLICQATDGVSATALSDMSNIIFSYAIIAGACHGQINVRAVESSNWESVTTIATRYPHTKFLKLDQIKLDYREALQLAFEQVPELKG